MSIFKYNILAIFAIIAIIHCNYASAQDGFIRCPAQAEINGNFNQNDRKLFDAQKQQAFAGACQMASFYHSDTYYKGSSAPWRNYIISPSLKTEMEKQKKDVVAQLSKIHSKYKDLGYEKIYISAYNEYRQVWKAQIEQNMKSIETETISRLSKNLKLMNNIAAMNVENVAFDDMIKIKRILGEVIVDLLIVDIFMNIKPIYQDGSGVFHKISKNISYTAPQKTPVICVLSVTTLDSIYIKIVPNLKDWDTYDIVPLADKTINKIIVKFAKS